MGRRLGTLRERRDAPPLVACAILLGVSAAAPAAGSDEDGFTLRFPFVVELFREIRPVAGPEETAREGSETTWLLRPPAPGFGVGGRRGELAVEYQPELEWYQERGALAGVNHHASVGFDYALTRRLSLDAGDVLIDVRDPSRLLQRASFLTSTGRYRENASWIELGYSWTRRTDLTVRLDTLVSRVESRVSDLLLDSRTIAGTISLSRDLSRGQAIAMRWSLLGAIRREEPPLATHNVSVSYRVAPDSGFQTEISGGLIAGDGSTYSLSARTEKALGPLRLAVGYDRGLAFFGPPAGESGVAATPTRGIPTEALFQAVRIDAGGALAKSLRLDLEAWAAERTAAGLDGEEDRSFFGRLTIQWRFRVGFAAFFAVEAQGQESPAEQPALASRRYHVGIAIDPTGGPRGAPTTPRGLGGGLPLRPPATRQGGGLR